MENPEKKESKDQIYFAKECERLADEARLAGEPKIASVLFALVASLKGRPEDLDALSSEIVKFGEKMLAVIEEKKKMKQANKDINLNNSTKNDAPKMEGTMWYSDDKPLKKNYYYADNPHENGGSGGSGGVDGQNGTGGTGGNENLEDGTKKS